MKNLKRIYNSLIKLYYSKLPFGCCKYPGNYFLYLNLEELYNWSFLRHFLHLLSVMGWLFLLCRKELQTSKRGNKEWICFSCFSCFFLATEFFTILRRLTFSAMIIKIKMCTIRLIRSFTSEYWGLPEGLSKCYQQYSWRQTIQKPEAEENKFLARFITNNIFWPRLLYW